MRCRSRHWWVLVIAAPATLVVGACTTSAAPACHDIPPGGCPADRGGTCDDPVCSAIYTCGDGEWQWVNNCPGGGVGGANAGGGGLGGAANVGGGGVGGEGGEGGCHGVVIDKRGQTSGCSPGLMPPDCGVAVAEGCAPCLGDCSDFFLCTADGWVTVAFCDQDGQLVVE